MGGRELRKAIGAAALSALLVSPLGGEQPSVVKVPGRVSRLPGALATPLGVVHVKVVDQGGAPLPSARVRLRDLSTGREAAVATTNAADECNFAPVDAGTYVVEAIGRDGGVVGVSDATTVVTGETAEALVRLTARSRSFAWWLGATTTAALAQAAGLGVFAVDPGQPVTPQR
jgi:hypothetical protein